MELVFPLGKKPFCKIFRCLCNKITCSVLSGNLSDIAGKEILFNVSEWSCIHVASSIHRKLKILLRLSTLMCDIFLCANNNFYVVLRSLKWLRLKRRVSAANTIFRGAWARPTSHSFLTSLVSTRKSVFHLTSTIECNL